MTDMQKKANLNGLQSATAKVGDISIHYWRGKPLWMVMFLAAFFYYVGWWLPWPLLGLHAPTPGAEMVHFLATVLTMTGILMARKSYR